MGPLKAVTELEPTKKAFSLLEEFHKFAFKGNVIDLAVAVIVGGAFGKIVESLVKDILVPLISMLMPTEQHYTQWMWIYRGKEIHYGTFIGEVINFLIISFVLFLFIVKLMGWLLRLRKKEALSPPPPMTREQELLTEIRDLLKKQSTPASTPTT